MSAGKPSNERKRLDSWKEVAAFFGRDERTVNRWEKELDLPVHRLPGTKGRVYAYTDELLAWAAASKNGDAAVEGHNPVGAAVGASGSVLSVRQPLPVQSGPAESWPGAEEKTAPAGHHRRILGLLASATLIMGALVLLLFHPGTSHSSKTAGMVGSRQQDSSSVVRASTRSHNPEAEQLYLKGRYYWDKRTPADLNRALDYFMQAVVHDPNYGPAYSGLADTYNLLREYSMMPSNEAYPRALAAAKKAVELDDQSSETHASLAFVSFFGEWDIATGEHEFRRAVDLNPDNATAHHWYANALLALHRLPEALAEIERAQTLNPASSAILADRGNILCAAGRLDESLSLLKQMENRDPSFRSLHLYLARVYFRKQDYPEYISELRKDALAMHDDAALAVATAAESGLAAGGERGMLEAILRIQEKLYARHSVSPTALAWTLTLLGNKSEALRYLNAAYEQHDGSLLFVENWEFDALRDEPAFRDLLARINLPVDGRRPSVP